MFSFLEKSVMHGEEDESSDGRFKFIDLSLIPQFKEIQTTQIRKMMGNPRGSLVLFSCAHRIVVESNPSEETSSCQWGTSVLTTLLKMRMNQPAVVMILCHDQESITSVGSR